MSQSRQLAAIMFTDVVGYSALMEEDEQKAFDLLNRNRQLHKPIIEKYNGRWLKEIGDGILASFTTISDAVYAAGEIQAICENDPDLKLRIGIHQGEVVFDGNDVFGSGVNIASRLEPIAPVGGILVSESVHRNLGNKKNIKSTFLGEEQLKNVKEPIKIYSLQVESAESAVIAKLTTRTRQLPAKNRNPVNIRTAVLGVFILFLVSYFLYTNFSSRSESVAAPIGLSDKSIVVLPFTNLSSDPEQEYFSDGMMEEILNRLVKIEDLKVISRTTAMQYKGTNKSVSEITKELNVAIALEGSVRKDGDNVRITVQLIEGDSDTHLWSESYDRELKNIFQVQSDVAQQVAIALDTELKPEVIQSIDRIPTENMEAYDKYLQALNNFNIFDPQYLRKNVQLLTEAIELDSNFSSPYALLGSIIIFRSAFTGKYSPKEVADSGKVMLEKALLLDPKDGVAHANLGAYYMWYEKDFRMAEIAFKSAMEFSPSYNEVDQNLTDFYLSLGRFQEALVPAKRLLKYADNTPSFWGKMALVSAFLDQEEVMANSISNARPDSLYDELTFTEIARAYLVQKDYANVVVTLIPFEDLHDIPRSMGLLAIAYYKLGDLGESERWLNSLLKISEQTSGGSPSFYSAMTYAAMNKTNQAFEWLDKSLDENEIELYWLKVEPEFASLYNDPRWQEILDKVGFPQ